MAAIYEALEANGLSYGPAFRTISRVRRDGGDLWVDLAPRAAVAFTHLATVQDALRLEGMAAPVRAELRVARTQLRDFVLAVDAAASNSWFVQLLSERGRRVHGTLSGLEESPMLTTQRKTLAEIRSRVDRALTLIRKSADPSGEVDIARANALTGALDAELEPMEMLIGDVISSVEGEAAIRGKELEAESRKLDWLTWILGMGYVVLVGVLWRWSSTTIVRPLQQLDSSARSKNLQNMHRKLGHNVGPPVDGPPGPCAVRVSCM